MILYIAGPYRASSPELVDQNIASAKLVAIAVWKAGHVAVWPHGNTHHFEIDSPEIPVDQILDGDLRLVERCDGVVLCPDWNTSAGARLEREHADSLGMPVWFYPDVPSLHPTEMRCPTQTRAFVQTVMKMFRIHLDKNDSYSPSNIIGTGFVGLVTRLWDKTARILELSGFRLKLSEPSEYVGEKQSANESIEDSLLDNANYSVIGLLLRAGKWGR
jgi:nucleoside 2-deoxyribosyltransferase